MFSKQQIEYRSAGAKLTGVNAKISEKKAGSLVYSINDNATVQGIRDKIVTREVDLAKLSQKYTDKYPSVIAVRQTLVTLRQNLKYEVGVVVASKVASLNPTQSILMIQQTKGPKKQSIPILFSSTRIKTYKER